MSDVGTCAIEVSVGEVVSYLRIEGGFSEALSHVVRRKLLLRAADEAGISASTEELQRAADAYRAINGLHKASDTVAWMRNDGITADVLEKHLEENIRISRARDHIAASCDASITEQPVVKTLIRELSVEDWLNRKLGE
jgi:hypothetical protein